MITADAALVLLVALVVMAITSYVAGTSFDRRRRERFEAERREPHGHLTQDDARRLDGYPPLAPYDWQKEGSA